MNDVPISTLQIQKIYAAAREQGIDNDALHSLVYREVSKESIRMLTKNEGIKVIKALVNTPAPAERKGMITEKQYKMILGLSHSLGWEGNLKRINGFVKKFSSVENVNWLTMHQASSVIEGLKKLEGRMKEGKVE